jgi:hypothetical protein
MGGRRRGAGAARRCLAGRCGRALRARAAGSGSARSPARSGGAAPCAGTALRAAAPFLDG